MQLLHWLDLVVELESVELGSVWSVSVRRSKHLTNNTDTLKSPYRFTILSNAQLRNSIKYPRQRSSESRWQNNKISFQVSVVSIKSRVRSINIFGINQIMVKKGWNLSTCYQPQGIHLTVTHANAPHWKQYVKDIKESVAEVDYPQYF